MEKDKMSTEDHHEINTPWIRREDLDATNVETCPAPPTYREVTHAPHTYIPQPQVIPTANVEPGYTFQTNPAESRGKLATVHGENSGSPAYLGQPGAPIYSVEPGAPRYPVQSGTPGYPVKQEAGFPVQYGAPGYTAQPVYNTQQGTVYYNVQSGVTPTGIVQPGLIQPVVSGQPLNQATAITIIRDRPNNHFGFNLFVCLCCCPLFGIIGMFYGCESNSKFQAGNDAGAAAASRTAKLWGFAGLLLGIVGMVITTIMEMNVADY